MESDRVAEGIRDAFEVIGIARDDQIPPGQRTDDNGRVDDIRGGRPPARDTRGTCA